MGLKVHNTLTRKKEDFKPIQPGKVGMYVCGVTVYDSCHIGHGRSMVMFDVIYRYLKTNYSVTYVRNFTDIDDKIINRANERGEDWKGLAQRYIDEFYRDMDRLGVQRPDHEPKATEHIPEIVTLIGKLIDRGHAYQAGEDVVYAVGNFSEYGKLSGKKIDDLVSGARVEVDDKKRNPLDFVLWKGAKPGEPHWSSPWGEGRPGWHIECSAMSTKYLGNTFDIHGGGADLVFPHHENEIAQSEGAEGTLFVKYWMHNGFVNIKTGDKDEKMSKSLGNVLNIGEILDKVHPEALRLFLLSSHYRSPLDYSEESIGEATAALERLYSAVAVLGDLAGKHGTQQKLPEELLQITDRFRQAMDDDFNTPRALAVLFEAARAVNRISTEAGSDADQIPAPMLLEAAAQEMISLASEILGILNEEPSAFFEQLQTIGAADKGLSPQEIEDLVTQRSEARKQKDFGRADEIRDELAEKGVVLKDGPEGTTWSFKRD